MWFKKLLQGIKAIFTKKQRQDKKQMTPKEEPLKAEPQTAHSISPEKAEKLQKQKIKKQMDKEHEEILKIIKEEYQPPQGFKLISIHEIPEELKEETMAKFKGKNLKNVFLVMNLNSKPVSIEMINEEHKIYQDIRSLALAKRQSRKQNKSIIEHER